MTNNQASLTATISLIDRLTPELTRVQTNLAAFSRTAQQNAATGINALTTSLTGVGTGITNFGNNLNAAGQNVTALGVGLGALTAPLAALGVMGIRTAANFQDAMVEIQVRTGATAEEMAMLRETAIEMGATTIFSAQQSAEAMLQLLTSGQNTSQALATLPTILAAAAASGEQLGATADSITDIMSTFNITAEDSGRVANALAQGAGASSATMSSLSQGLANVGPVANNLEMSFEDTVAALALLQEAGIRGAEGGTALKSMLLSQTRVTEEATDALDELGVSLYDLDGNIRNVPTIMNELSVALDALTDEDRIRLSQALAGSYGILAQTVLTGSTSIEDMRAAMEQQIGVAEIADAKMKTFNATIGNLSGGIESLSNSALTPFMDNVLTPLAIRITEIIDQTRLWSEANPQLTQQILSVIAAGAAMATGLVVLGGVVSLLGTGIAALGATVGALGAAFAFIISPVGIVLSLIATLGAVVQTAYPGGIPKAFTDAATSASQLGQILQTVLSNAAATASSAIAGVGAAIAPVIVQIEAAINSVQRLASNLNSVRSIADSVGTIGGALSSGQTDIGSVFNAAANAIASEFTPRAKGGQFTAGERMLVGEQGPELVIPSRSGTVIPAAQTADLINGGSTTNNITIYATNSDPNAIASAVMRGINDAMRMD